MPARFPCARPVAALLLAGFTSASAALSIVSDGSDGAFSGGGTLALDADGVFNFTTIHVTSGLSFLRNAANTPVVLAATGDVLIDATISVSAGNFNGVGGPGGGDGGADRAARSVGGAAGGVPAAAGSLR